MSARFTDRGVSRRGALRVGGAALTAGLSGLAGCSGLPPLGSEVRYGSVDAPAASDPAYRQWLPAPSAFGRADDDYHVAVYVPERARDPPVAASIARSVIAHVADYVGLHLDDTDLAFVGDSVAVLLGDVDRDAVNATLADTRYEPDGSAAGYDLYVRSDTQRLVGVRDGQILSASGSGAREAFRAVVDARRGDGPRYVDADADFDALVRGSGLRQWGLLHPGSTGNLAGHGEPSDGTAAGADPVGWATGFDEDERGLYFVETSVFPEGADVTERDVRRRLAERNRAIESSAVDVSVDGRVATVEMHLTREHYRNRFGDDPLVAPHVTWGVTHEADAERLTFHHEAGDPVPTDELVVRGIGDEPKTSFEDVGERVEPGEDVTVSTAAAGPGDTARLVLESGDGSASMTQVSYDLS